MKDDILRKYEKMCEKSVRLNNDFDDNEEGHIHQDKVYRIFINDICEGNLNSLKSIKSVAQMIKKDVVKYDKSTRRWYA